MTNILQQLDDTAGMLARGYVNDPSLSGVYEDDRHFCDERVFTDLVNDGRFEDIESDVIRDASWFAVTIALGDLISENFPY